MAATAGADYDANVGSTNPTLGIDPATNKVTGKPVPVGKPLPAEWSTDSTAITAGPTGLWVLDFDRNLLFHLAIKPSGR